MAVKILHPDATQPVYPDFIAQGKAAGEKMIALVLRGPHLVAVGRRSPSPGKNYWNFVFRDIPPDDGYTLLVLDVSNPHRPVRAGSVDFKVIPRPGGYPMVSVYYPRTNQQNVPTTFTAYGMANSDEIAGRMTPTNPAGQGVDGTVTQQPPAGDGLWSIAFGLATAGVYSFVASDPASAVSDPHTNIQVVAGWARDRDRAQDRRVRGRRGPAGRK